MADLVIQVIDSQGVVESETIVTEQERLEAHQERRCDAWCSYCYHEACSQ